jgi:hypothetical protein
MYREIEVAAAASSVVTRLDRGALRTLGGSTRRRLLTANRPRAPVRTPAN